MNAATFILRRRRHRSVSCVILIALCAGHGERLDASNRGRAPTRPRARDIGIVIGVLPPGPLNAITDVAGVRVGHKTIIHGDSVRTGVTAILPHGRNPFQQMVPAAVEVGNGFGKLVGSTQIAELGVIETPIVLTNTLSTFTAADALITWTLGLSGNEHVRSVNPIVAETNDADLNDIRGRHVSAADVLEALASARGGEVPEGSVGAGTGTRCMGWKGGIGTASRRLPDSLGGHTVGVIVQSNFQGILVINGAPVGRELGRYSISDQPGDAASEAGSCVIVVATDAPLDARRLQRLARRSVLALGVVGSPMKHGSGDYVIAFSTAEAVRIERRSRSRFVTSEVLRDDALSPLFQAVKEATEEAIINSLLRATTVSGFQGRVAEAIPIARVVEICRRYGAAKP